MQDFERTKRAILDRVDIASIVSEHVALKRRGQRLVGLCPFHTEKTPSFTVSPQLGLFKCFGCGKGGDVFSFVQLRENVGFLDAARMLADRVGIEFGTIARSDKKEPSRLDIARINDWGLRYFQKNLEHPTIGADARNYIVKRGFSESIIAKFGLGLACSAASSLIEAARRAGISVELLRAADLVRAGDDGHLYETFRDRLIFPIRDVTRRVIGFGGRTLVDDRAKYLNTRQNALFDKGKSLYGLDAARDAIAAKGVAVVVEGYTDCLAAHQAGFTETVATLGTALTESHVDLLRRYAEGVILLFDSDDAGGAAAERAIRVALPRNIQCRLARIPAGKDPSEFLAVHGQEAFSDVLNTSHDALEFKWFQTRERFGADASDVRRREALLDFLRLVAEAVDTQAIDAIQRGLVVNQVAHLVQLDRAEVDRMIGRLQPRARGSSRQHQPREPGNAGGPLDQEQAAWVTFLEVALAEPTALASVESFPDPGRIADAHDRRLTALVVKLARETDSFALADVLAHLQDAGDTQRVTELAHAGIARANFDARLAGALDRIRRAQQHLDWEAARQTLQTPPQGADTSGNEQEGLARIVQGAREYRGFLPRRLVRQARAEREISRHLPTEHAAAESS